MQGRVKSFDVGRFYGFIATEAGDFFFHGSDVIGEISHGDIVNFWLDDSTTGSQRLKAVEVQKHV
jgi:cold shock CspA family protein